MSFSPNNDVQIARRPSMRPRITLARDTNTLPIACPRLYANFERLSARDHALSVAHRARRNILTRAMAPWAGHVELHPSAGLLDRAFAFALRTHTRLLNNTVAVAVRAYILARDVKPHDAAANRRPEWNVDLILEIATRLRAFLRNRAPAPAAEHTGEDVAESAAAS